MEWIGLSGCLILSIACFTWGVQFWKAHKRTHARIALATVVYLALFSWFIVDYYSTTSILTTVVKAIPVEFGIGFLITFHTALLAYSVKHPPFGKRVYWSEARRNLGRQLMFLTEGAIICFYCYCGVLFRDASLYVASQTGNYPEVQRSLALGADPYGGIKIGGFIDEPVNGCLETALNHKHFGIARLLIAHGAPLDLPDPLTHRTPLMYEVARHNKQAVIFLLDCGASANLTTGNGLTALKLAANDYDIALLLVKHGVFVNTTTLTGSTALFDFARAGNAKGVKLLIEHGAYVPVVTRSGLTPLMDAAQSGNPATAAELIFAGENCTLTDTVGRDALWYAKAGNHKDVANLIEHQIKYDTYAPALHKRELKGTLTL